jgi:uncharacterized iron-regulated membrane protein
MAIVTTYTQQQGQAKSRFKTLLAIHGWSGALLGLLLYAVIVTGVVAVFAHEIGNWSNPLSASPNTKLGTGLDASLRQVATTIPPDFYEDISIFHHTGERVKAFFHTHRKQENGAIQEEGVEIDLDPNTWQELDRREGTAAQVRAQNTPSALSQFLVDLHVRLYLPDPWGLLLTGVLGLAMLVAAVTGLIVHRRLLRELFVLRLSQRNPLLTRRDRHTLAGSWNLLFAFILAFTGSFFSFAGSFGIPAMAMVAFGGDQEKMIETVVGRPEASDATPAPLTNLDTVLADARMRSAGAEPGALIIQRWGRADAVITVSMMAADGALSGRTFVYDGVSGELKQEKPLIGLQPSVGNTLVSLMGPLHFGNFAGVASKAVWFGLGTASAYVVLTGLLLWTHRRQDQPRWQPLARLTVWMGYGLPLALAASACGFFSAHWLGTAPLTGVKGGFLAAVFGVSLASLVTTDPAILRVRLLAGNIMVLVLAPILRWLAGGMDWGAALQAGWWEIPALDSLLLAGAVMSLFAIHRTGRWKQPYRLPIPN